MPQLNKTNILLTFMCTWMTLLTIMNMMKKINITTNQPLDTTMQTLPSWPWPYT